MGYVLGRGLSFARIDGRAIFLDTLGDRYFTLTPDQQNVLDRLLDRSIPDDACNRAVGPLIHCGILTMVAGDAVPNACGGPRTRGCSSVFDSTVRPSVGLVLFAVCRLLIVRFALRWRPLGAVVGHVVRARRRAGEPLDADILAERLSAAFVAADRIVSPHRRCLGRSLALAGAFANRGIGCELVVGVALNPFRAHCWVQRGARILNDDVGRVHAFTPVLVV
jgi:hypothetical protein